MPTVLIILAALLVLLLLIILIRTALFRNPVASSAQSIPAVDDLPCAEKLVKAIQIPTISHADYSQTDWNEFQRFHALLEELFPLVHKTCKKTVINGYSLVYRWRAPKADPALKPVLFTAHMDVVPVEPGTEPDWQHSAFSGEIAEGVVWGRGALDTKIQIVAALESAERLLAQGFAPKRDIFFAFGHDEEINGEEGALKIADYFKQQGMKFEFVLDEGGCVVEHVLDGVEKPIALVGVAEKGFSNIRLSVTGEGGHSSMPPRNSSLGILAQAVCRLEQNQAKARLIPMVREFLLRVGPEMKGVNRVILANLWLFKPLFIKVFAKSATGGAMLRTTTAVTMAEGSPAANIMPQKSTAVANFRILPGETGQDLLRHIREAVEGLPVDIEPIVLDDPSKVSPSNSEGYHLIEQLTQGLYPGTVVTPYLVMGSTDARKYECVCENIYRFSPYKIDSGELDKMHGTNENITVENVGRCTAFFTELFKRC